MKIELSEYDPAWRDIFLKEKPHLEKILPLNSRIEHIGSTSVEGLCAKPTIDILCGIDDLPSAGELIAKIAGLDYQYIEKYNALIPERRYFTKAAKNNYHLHLVQTGGPFWERHLLFRDFLRQNEAVKKEYASLKRALALKDWSDGNEYAAAKTEFIKAVEERARHLK
jgi:GrpB-like predicted nucleotidyltransferase (UPF0157 family)